VKKKKMKTTTRLIGVVAIAMTLTIAFSGVALACCPINETACTSSITTTTDITCQGTMTEDESLSFTQSSVNLSALPPLAVPELYGDTRYRESMIARDGYMDYYKDFNLDTANSGGLPDYNLDVVKTFDYNAEAAGGLTFSESVAMDDVSTFQATPNLMCPFAAALPRAAGIVPESCEYVLAGSTLDVTQVSATTHAQTITTAMSVDTTPKILHYDVRAGGTDLTGTPGAVGSGTAHMTVHELEGRPVAGDLGTEVIYEEEATVSGIFEFSKTMDYESGVLRP
jgi:hypothetical protein